MPQPSRRPMIGRLLDGRYRVLGHVADGGMATVWRAMDERLEREVAVKILRPGLADDATLAARFRSEARSAARLNDPRVVAVYDQGEDDGDLFLVMELVEGRTLREVIHADAPLTPRAALDILEPVAGALGLAHGAGLLHRDVKPENVIIRDDGQVKVADFGLARAVTAATTAVTGASTVLGTVSYLSPEQVEQGASDARSDVYALGIVAFEMLTGRKPFEGDSPIHVAYQHVHGQVPAPSTLVSHVPPAADELVRRMTSRSPGERPADGREVADLVRTVRAGLDDTELDARPAPGAPTSPTVVIPVTADTTGHAPTAPTAPVAPASPTPVATTEPSRPRRRAALVAVPLALLLAGGGGAGWYYLAGPGATTTVPELSRVSLAEAQSRLESAHLDAATSEAYSETVPKGQVIAAAPVQGTTVHRGDDIALTISKGPERYGVPQLAGKTADDARAALTAGHLLVGSVNREYDEKIPEGSVVSSTPAAGTQLKPRTPVSLVLSKGRRPISVPTLVGATLDAATAKAADRGLVVEQAERQVYSSSVPRGSVVAQEPSTGTLYRGDSITVTVSKGPEMVTVPGVVGKQLADARSELQAAGFQVKVKEVLGGMFGFVREQSVSGGDQAPKGSTITLTIV